MSQAAPHNTTTAVTHNAFVAPMHASVRRPVVNVPEGMGAPVTDSRDVAAFFGRAHKNVIQALRNSEEQCSPDFARLNFQPVFVEGRTRLVLSHYLLTKDAFTFAVLGFTGGDAARFKEAYIAEFNRMEDELRRRDTPAPQADIMTLLRDPRAALELIGHYATQTLALQAEVEEKGRALVVSQNRVAEQRPVVEAFKEIADASGSYCITDAAKVVGVRPIDLRKHLRDHEWIYTRKGGSEEIAAQCRLNDGCLVHKVYVDPAGVSHVQVRVTAKGVARLSLAMHQRLPGL